MWKMIDFYIKKSKKDRNYEAQIYAYRYSTTYSKYPRNIAFADSALEVAKKSGKDDLLSSAYINRGKTWMDEKRYQKSLDDMLQAIKYSNKIGDNYTTYKTRYFIAQNKIYLGLYDEAIEELKPCIIFFKNNINNNSLGKDYEMFYMYSLMSYIDTNSKIYHQKENKPLLTEAFDYIKKNNLPQYLPYFVASDGINSFYAKNYKIAIEKLNKALALYNDKRFHYTETFYLGMSNWQLGNKEKAVRYFKLIDAQYTKNGKLDPHFRPTYEYLIKYYKAAGSKDLQLVYVNKLMELDRNYEKNYKYLYTTINKEYDTKKLQQEKSQLENSLQKQRIFYAAFFLIALFGGLFFVYRYLKLKKQYREKFENIIHPELHQTNKSENLKFYSPLPPADAEEIYYDNVPGINPQIVEHIVMQLENLEKEKLYLDPQLSQKSLSESIGTNSTYLSKIINIYKNKNFNHYINDLRMDYLLTQLKTKRKYLNKDVNQLAVLSGFNSTESFSKNFQRKFEMKPSVFIKLMKENAKNSA